MRDTYRNLSISRREAFKSQIYHKGTQLQPWIFSLSPSTHAVVIYWNTHGRSLGPLMVSSDASSEYRSWDKPRNKKQFYTLTTISFWLLLYDQGSIWAWGFSREMGCCLRRLPMQSRRAILLHSRWAADVSRILKGLEWQAGCSEECGGLAKLTATGSSDSEEQKRTERQNTSTTRQRLPAWQHAQPSPVVFIKVFHYRGGF